LSDDRSPMVTVSLDEVSEPKQVVYSQSSSFTLFPTRAAIAMSNKPIPDRNRLRCVGMCTIL
jgi:hypothetical protein